MSFNDWGKPHGCTDMYAESEIHREMFYRYGLARDGAHFELFKEKHHTNIEVEEAKKWLRKNQDVLSIKVIQEL